jgi:hypothetical protein
VGGAASKPFVAGSGEGGSRWFTALVDLLFVLSRNATERGARNAVLNTGLGEFAGYRLVVDCGNTECGGERIYNIGDLTRTRWPHAHGAHGPPAALPLVRQGACCVRDRDGP